MFDQEFYPTPVSVLDQMGIDCYGKVCAELQAGKGDIVNYLTAYGAKEVLACEKNDQLRKLLSDSCRIIGTDAFKVRSEDVSHINMIVMNPPFSNADEHILHAWNIAPEGCEIISLCNYTTIYKDAYEGGRKELQTLIKNYGEKEDLGNCFDQAERKTNVQVGLVRLFKPVTSSEFDYEGFYLDVEEERGENGIMQYNEIRAIVNNYIAAVNCFDRFQDISSEMNRYTGAIGFHGGLTCTITHERNTTNKADFAKALQKSAWKYIFDKMNMSKYVTKGVMEKINKFIETRQNYPFTMKNIYRMFEIIIGTREQTMNKAIEEAIDNYTKHTHENRFGVEGWKTNAGYMLNKKFISNYIAEHRYSGGGMSIKTSSYNYEYLVDLCKALCYVTGRNFSDIPDIRNASCERDEEGKLVLEYKYKDKDGVPIPHMMQYHDVVGQDRFETNRWYDWGFFQFKVFKKGTGHFKFKNEDDWAVLNRAYAKIKGQVLPEKL